MEFLNYDTATPLSSTSFMIKQFGKERNTGVVSVNKIHPMSVLELKKLVKNRTGSENYKIVSVGENNFYYFYSKESVFYYHPLGLLIQHHSKKISPSKIKLVKR